MDRISGSALLAPGPGKAGLPGQRPEGAWGPGRSGGDLGLSERVRGVLCRHFLFSTYFLIFSGRAPLRGAAPCRPLLPAGEQAAREGSKGKNRDGRKGRSAGIFPPLPQTCSDFTAVALPQDPLGGKKKRFTIVFSPCPVPTPAAAPGLFAPPACPDGAYGGGAAAARVLRPC